MKKLLTLVTFTVITLAICLFANRGYDGPKDETAWLMRESFYEGLASYETTLGILARYSDVIGVGRVSNKTNDHFTITIDHALVGCTNGAVFLLYGTSDHYWDYNYDKHMLEDYLPTNQSRIVFAAHTNAFSHYSRMYWNHAEIPAEPEYIRENLSLRYLNRSWWHADRDDGMLLTQFTNVLQAARFDRNWTNYFYLCRDGANLPSNRVREDSFRDLRKLCQRASDERAQFILDDPLVDPKHKSLILEPIWRYPEEMYPDN